MEGKGEKEVMSVKQEAVGGMQWQQCGVMEAGKVGSTFLHHAPRGGGTGKEEPVGLDLTFLDYPEAGGVHPCCEGLNEGVRMESSEDRLPF